MPAWAREFMYLLSKFLGLYLRAFSILIWFFMKSYSTVRTESFPMFLNLQLSLKHKWYLQSHSMPASLILRLYRAVIFCTFRQTCNDFCSSQDLKKVIE